MARSKARVRLSIRCKWTFFTSSYRWGATRQNVKCHCFQDGVGQFEPRFQGEGVIPLEYFLVSRKLHTFCYLRAQTAPCYVQSFWHNTGAACDRRTDGIAVASTALSMRALRRAVKSERLFHIGLDLACISDGEYGDWGSCGRNCAKARSHSGLYLCVYQYLLKAVYLYSPSSYCITIKLCTTKSVLCALAKSIFGAPNGIFPTSQPARQKEMNLAHSI